MAAITLNRNEVTAIPFTITDAGLGLGGKRVTWAVSDAPSGLRVLRKVGGLPGSTADITILTHTAGTITGTVNIGLDDFTLLPLDNYVASLWVDDGIGGDRLATVGGVDTVKVVKTVARGANS